MRPGRLLLILLLTSITLVLVAQFPLGNWAEANGLHHQLQHGLIFLSGVGVGVAVAGLHRLGQHRASA